MTVHYLKKMPNIHLASLLSLLLLLTAAACRHPEPALPSARVIGIKDGDSR